MKIFVDSEEYTFLLQDSFSKDLEYISPGPNLKSTVVVVTIDNKHKKILDEIDTITKKTTEIVKAVKGLDYFNNIITSINFADLTEMIFLKDKY